MREPSFDDLARALSTPMPRRRALRLLGSALVLAVVPALRPSRGGAASEPGARPASADAAGRDLAVIGPPGPFGGPVPCGDVVCNPTYNCVKCCPQGNGLPGSCCPCYITCRSGSGLCGEQVACPPDGRPFC